MRFSNGGATPTLEICTQDTWITLESDFQISSGGSVISELNGAALGSTGIALRWDTQGATDVAVASYEITCSSDSNDITLSVSGGSEAATFTHLAPSTDYRCCVVAHQDRSIFDLVTLTSPAECVSVQLGGSTSTAEAAASQSRQAVTFALGGLVGLLVIAVLVVAVSCICVMLSKRRQVTHPR